MVFHAGFDWVGVEGAVLLAGPDDHDPGVGQESIPGLLREVFVAAGGTHDDWAEYDRTMIAERRVAVFVQVDRIISDG